MLSIYRAENQELQELEQFQPGCWIHLSDPTEAELTRVEAMTGVLPEFLRAALDEEERSRIETDENQTLVLCDLPRVELEGKNYVYTTIPMGIVHLEDCLITVCLIEPALVRDFVEGRVRNLETHKKTRFILRLLHRNATRYLWYLRQIDQASNRLHAEMQRSYRNKELLQMMALEKSLVYFSTSLMSNEAMLEKMVKVDYIKKYPDDEELLDDVIIENKQAIEMCVIYRDILSGTMDAYASIISNNLNIVMKLLAAITIILSVPTLLYSAWGMNVGGIPFSEHPYGFAIVAGISVAITLVSVFVMWRKKMF